MTIYQKAIKVRKVCETQSRCGECKYFDKCKKSNILFFSPADEDIKDIAKAIKDEKWVIK